MNTKIKLPVKLLQENKILKKNLSVSKRELSKLLSGSNSNEEFKTNEVFYRALIEKGSDLISLWDKNGKLLWFSPSVKKILGYETKKFKGIHRTNFIHKDDVPFLNKALSQVLKKSGNCVNIKYRIKDIKGAWHSCEGTMTNLLNVPGVNAIVSNLKDVTEKKKFDIEQKLSEEKFKNILQNTRDVIYHLDIKRKNYIYVSPSTEQLFGIPAERFLKNHFGVLKNKIHKDDRAYVSAHMNDIFTKESKIKKDFLLEYRIIRGKTDIKWVADSQTVFYDEKGNPSDLFGNVTDITFRKIAQQELQNSYDLQKGYLNLLTSIQNALPAEIALLDKEGNIIAVNEAWGRFTREDALVNSGYGVGVNYLRICDESKNKRSKESHDTAAGIKKVLKLKIQNFTCEYPCHTSDAECWYQLEVTPINKKRNEGVVVMHIDITERVKAEKAVKESEKQYQALFYQSSIPMFIWNADNYRFLAVNKAALKHYGYSEKDFLKLNLFDIAPKNLNHNGHEPDDLGLSKHLKKDGSILNVEVTYVNILFGGQPAVLTSVNDFTEMLKYEESLKERNNEMSHLYKAGTQLSATLDAETIYNNSYKIITEIIPCDTIIISSYDSKNKIITCRAAWMLEEKLDSSKFPPLPLDETGRGVQSSVIINGISRIVNNYDSYSRKGKYNYYVNSQGAYKKKPDKNDEVDQSAMVVPMKLDGKVIGVIQVFSDKKDAYNEDNMRILEAISTQFSVSTANALLYQQAQKEIKEREKAELALKKKTDEITFLYEVEKEISSTLEIDIIYDKIYKVVSEIMACDSLIISSYNKEEKLIRCLAIWADGTKLDVTGFSPIPLAPKGFGIQSMVIRSGQPRLILDYETAYSKAITKHVYTDDKSTRRKASVYSSALIVPMKVEGKVIGVLQVLSYKKDAFNNDNLRILEALTLLLSAATANAILYQQSKKEIEQRIITSEKLRSSELHLLASQQIAKIGSWELDISDPEDLNSNTLIWSDEAYRMFGFQPGEVEVTNDLFYSMVHPDDLEIVDKTIRDAINAKTKYSVEHRIVLNSGEIKYVQEKSDISYDAVTGKPLKMIGTVQDITEQKNINTQLIQSLHEKELMLKEVHHRVKNNLQVVSSLLRIQAANVDDKRVGEYLKISEQRVQSMALIHQQLYRTEDLSRIDFGTYVRELCSYLFFAYGIDQSRIKLEVNIDNIFFGIDTALPCGLIINELVTNALKHAFPDGASGKMNISLIKDTDGKNHLTIKDNGIGIDKDFDPEKTKTLGMQLVVTLSKQLESLTKISRKDGTNVELVFKDLTYKKRT